MNTCPACSGPAVCVISNYWQCKSKTCRLYDPPASKLTRQPASEHEAHTVWVYFGGQTTRLGWLSRLKHREVEERTTCTLRRLPDAGSQFGAALELASVYPLKTSPLDGIHGWYAVADLSSCYQYRAWAWSPSKMAWVQQSNTWFPL